MRIEFEAEGHNVRILAINKADAADSQSNFTDRCSFPLFQDLEEVDAWALHGGGKDDFFVFDAEGRLAEYVPIRDGEVDPVLSEEEGYNFLKQAAISALP